MGVHNGMMMRMVAVVTLMMVLMMMLMLMLMLMIMFLSHPKQTPPVPHVPRLLPRLLLCICLLGSSYGAAFAMFIGCLLGSYEAVPGCGLPCPKPCAVGVCGTGCELPCP
eukprot:9083948-Lingulodinium_polyedra.AAC.1